MSREAIFFVPETEHGLPASSPPKSQDRGGTQRERWQPETLQGFDDLADLLPAKLSADDAYALAARRHGVTVEEMRSRSRLAHLVAARVEAWRILRAQGWSLPAIGKAADRDHTTVMAALRGRA